MKIFRLLAALWFSIIPFGILTSIGVLAYFTFEGFTGILSAIVFFSIASFSGFYVFKTAMQTGIIKFMAINHSSPDLDNLKPTSSDNYQIFELKKLVESFKEEPTKYHGGNVKIWGDWQGRNLDEINEIKEINHEKASTILSIEFKNGNKLIITKPDIIIGGKTYLKIVKADKIEWQWDTVLEDYKYSIYRREGKKIKKDSNAKWFSLKTFISIGEPALMIAYKYNFSKPQDVILESFIVKK